MFVGVDCLVSIELFLCSRSPPFHEPCGFKNKIYGTRAYAHKYAHSVIGGSNPNDGVHYLFGIVRFLNYDKDAKTGGLQKDRKDPHATSMVGSLTKDQEWLWNYGDNSKSEEKMLAHFQNWEAVFVSVNITYLTNLRTFILNHFCFSLVLLHVSNSVLFFLVRL